MTLTIENTKCPKKIWIMKLSQLFLNTRLAIDCNAKNDTELNYTSLYL